MSMTNTQLFVVVDDSRSDSFVLGPTQWTSTTLPEWFNGTSQAPDFALNNLNGGNFGTVQFKFRGTSFAFFGVTPSISSGSQIFAVSIDGSPPSNTTYDDPNPPTYRQWYQSPLLAEGIHNVFLSHIAGASIDFATVTVGNNTPLFGERVITDNDDPGFIYDGRWKRSQAQFNSGPRPDGNPYHNSTHQTNEVGDNFTYQFSGTSIAIYGIFTWSNLGLITLKFTIDGQPLSETFRVNPDTPQFLSELGQQQNFLFKSFDFLSPTNHTLVVNLTNCANQTFAFDYVTYTPSFSTLANMPDFTQGLSDTSANNNTSVKKSFPVALLVGAVAGLVILLLLGGLVFIFRRRKKGNAKYKPINPFEHQRPEITVIRLATQENTPATASLYAASSSRERPVSTGSGLSYVDEAPAIPNPPVRSIRPLPPNPVIEPPNSGAVPRTGAADVDSPFLGRRDVFSQWGVSSEAGSLPPPYDETRGRLPPTVAPAF